MAQKRDYIIIRESYASFFIAGCCARAATGHAAAARAGSRRRCPVIGFMSTRSPEDPVHLLEAFRRGLKEGGFVEGENVAVQFRWARGDYGRLPALPIWWVGKWR